MGVIIFMVRVMLTVNFMTRNIIIRTVLANSLCTHPSEQLLTIYGCNHIYDTGDADGKLYDQKHNYKNCLGEQFMHSLECYNGIHPPLIRDGFRSKVIEHYRIFLFFCQYLLKFQ